MPITQARRKSMRAYRKANKEKIKQKSAEYYQKNKGLINMLAAQYVANNKEKVAKQKAKYYREKVKR